MDDFKLAETNAQKALSLNPDHLPSLFLESKALWSQDKNTDAIVLLNKALLKNYENSDIHWYLGKCYYNLKNYKKANEEFDRAIAKTPLKGEFYFDKGKTDLALSDFKSAFRDFAKSIELGYEPGDVYYYVGVACLGNKEYEEAIKSFTFSIDKNKSSAESYYQRGKIFAKQKKYDVALKDYKAAIDANPELQYNSTFLSEKGFLELHQGQNKEALVSFDNALESDEHAYEAQYGKACTLLQMGKENEALPLFEQAFKSQHMVWSSIKNDQFLQPIVKDKRFQDLVKKYL